MPLLELTALYCTEGQLSLRPTSSEETGNPVHREFSHQTYRQVVPEPSQLGVEGRN